MEARRFYLNTRTREFVTSPTSTLGAPAPVFFSEDVEGLELYFLRPTDTPSAPFEYLDYSGNTVKAAVGLTQPAALQTSWVSLATSITAGITTLVNGTTNVSEVQRLTLEGGQPVSGSISFTLPARAVTVSSVSAGVFTAANHGLLNGQSVTLSAFTISASSFENASYFVVQRTPDTFRIANTPTGSAINAQVTSGGGTATLAAITTPATASLNAAALQGVFVAAGFRVDGAPQIIVAGNSVAGFDIIFANTQSGINFDPLVVNSSLAAAPGLAANLSFNTTEIAALIAAGPTTGLRLEVEVSDGTRRQTYTAPVSISSDIITSTSPIPAPTGDTVSSLNFDDGSGGTWTVTVDANGILTATKQ
jgi:hypothetical protein